MCSWLDIQQLHAQSRPTDVGKDGRLLFSGTSAQKSSWTGQGWSPLQLWKRPTFPESLKLEFLGRNFYNEFIVRFFGVLYLTAGTSFKVFKQRALARVILWKRVSGT